MGKALEKSQIQLTRSIILNAVLMKRLGGSVNVTKAEWNEAGKMQNILASTNPDGTITFQAKEEESSVVQMPSQN